VFVLIFSPCRTWCRPRMINRKLALTIGNLAHLTTVFYEQDLSAGKVCAHCPLSSDPAPQSWFQHKSKSSVCISHCFVVFLSSSATGRLTPWPCSAAGAAPSASSAGRPRTAAAAAEAAAATPAVVLRARRLRSFLRVLDWRPATCARGTRTLTPAAGSPARRRRSRRRAGHGSRWATRRAAGRRAGRRYQGSARWRRGSGRSAGRRGSAATCFRTSSAPCRGPDRR
jgi:hypothetical protein